MSVVNYGLGIFSNKWGKTGSEDKRGRDKLLDRARFCFEDLWERPKMLIVLLKFK